MQRSEGTLSSDQENPVGEKAEGTMDSEALEQAKEEGRQEVLDSIKEDMDANVSAEEILDELLTKWKEMGYEFAPIDDLFVS